MTTPVRIFIIHTDTVEISQLQTVLEQGLDEVKFLVASTRPQILDMAATVTVDLILFDASVREVNYLELVEVLRGRKINIPIVLLTRPSTSSTTPVAMLNQVECYQIKSPEYLYKLPAMVAAIISRQQTRRFYQDISAPKELTRLFGRIAQVTNDVESFEQALHVYLDEICAYTGWPLGHAYLVDDSNKRFTISRYHYPDSPEFSGIHEVSNSIKYSVSAGLPGRVLHTRRPAWISDFNHAGNYLYAKYLTDYGLQSGIAFPVFIMEELVAVLEFFSQGVMEPDFEFLVAMMHASSQLGHVAERERTHQVLQMSEEKFATAFRSSPDAITIVALPAGLYTDVNQSFLQLFEFRRFEVIGASIGALSLWQETDREQAFFDDLRKQGLARNLEVELRKSSGKPLTCLVSAETINIGGTEHALVLYRDITERIETTAALRRSEGLLRSYFNTGFVGMAIINPDNCFLQVNDAVSDIFGYDPDQLLGMNVNTLICTEDMVEEADLFHRISAGEIDGYSREKRCRRQDGTIIDVSISTECVRKEGGAIVHLVAFFQDITRRKLGEQALRNSEASLRKAQQIAHLGFWETNLITNQLSISDEIYSICAIDKQTFNNERISFLNLIHPEDRQRFLRARDEMLRNNTPFSMEYRILCRDGSIRHAHTLGEVKRNTNGAAIGMVGTLLDITGRKTAELALSRSNRALRVLNECIHAIVHAASGQEMIAAVCSTIIETGSYRFAWVGYAQSDLSKTVYPVAKAGYESGYLENFFSWDKNSKKFDPVSEVINTGQPAVVNNLTAENIYGPLRNAAMARGYRSEIALPLKAGNQAFGALMIYSAEPDAFDSEEIQLLTSLADDLAFGILSLHTRAEHERTSRSVRAQENKYQLLYDANPGIFFTVDDQGIILTVNKYGAEQLGYTADELIGRSFSDLAMDTDRINGGGQLRTWLENPDDTHNLDQQLVRKDGACMWVNQTVRVITNAGVKSLLVVCADVTETRKQSEALAYQATHDSLTGLINRGEFEERLNKLLVSARTDATQHALCYLDLDRFRMINDTYGHVAGDELLRQVSVLLLGQIRKRDTVARLGGDEFAVLMEHCPLHRAEAIAKNLIQAIDGFQFIWGQHSFRLGVNIGLVQINHLSGNIQEVLNAADRACYIAKDQGLNRLHVVGDGGPDRVKKHGELRRLDEIRRALDEDGFELCFQAIESLQNRKEEVQRYEVLLRMQAVEGGLLNPDAFMPVAERYGLSVYVDKWVVSKLFMLMTAYHNQNRYSPQFFVNLSGHSLGNNELLEFIVNRMQDLSVAPEKICFEITETAAITNLTHAVRFINVLRETGCYFALDDFGSGLSSYAYLKNLQVDYLKIDGYFIKNITTDPVNLAIVRSMHEIGKALGKQTIAESVEDMDTLATVRKLGLDYAQGKHIAAELSFTEINRASLVNVVEFTKKS